MNMWRNTLSQNINFSESTQTLNGCYSELRPELHPSLVDQFSSYCVMLLTNQQTDMGETTMSLAKEIIVKIINRWQ